MEERKLKKIYNLKILWRVIFGRLNALLAFLLAIFFIGNGISRCSSGSLKSRFFLNIAPYPLNEAPKNPAGAANDSKIQIKITEKKTDSANLKDNILKIKKSKDPEWEHNFNLYAKKINIDNIKDSHRITFRLEQLPKNRPPYIELAFEIYSHDKTYLFTFYADNYWNQSGYDEGHWHQWNYTEKMDIQFPQKGDYYIVAGVPKSSSRSYSSQNIYNILQSYSRGRVFVQIYSGTKAVSWFGVIFAFIFFSGCSVLLYFRRDGTISKSSIVDAEFDFAKKDYIVKINAKNKKYLFHLTGFIKKQRSAKNEVELIITRNSQTAYLGVERDTVDWGDSEKTVYYFYYFGEYPENDFKNIPQRGMLEYRGKRFKLKEQNKLTRFNFYYSNGLKETVQKKITEYETSSWTDFLTFEYDEDPADFEVTYGYKIEQANIWEINKQ